jgi:hypothetical protein
MRKGVIIYYKKPLQVMDEFLKSLSPKELKAYNIAKSHLGSSFSAEKSVMYRNWLKTKKQQSTP